LDGFKEMSKSGKMSRKLDLSSRLEDRSDRKDELKGAGWWTFAASVSTYKYLLGSFSLVGFSERESNEGH
jgi:hypothetical protein